MPRIINIDILKPCDIILTTTTELISKGIRKTTKSDISHAMICVANGSAIDSTGEGVQARNIQKLFYDDKCSIHIMRLKRELSEQERNTIIGYARSVIGTPYTTREAIKSIANPKSTGSARQFCSRLAARAYFQANIKITENPDFCTPSEILNSPFFFEVKNPFIHISESEKKNIESRGTTLDSMRSITNKLLDLVRAIAPQANILSVNDIFSTLQSSPDLDEEISRAFIESGYLYHWEAEIIKHPWRYNRAAMEKLISENDGIIDEIIIYCTKTIKDHNDGAFNHWTTNFLTHQHLHKKTNLKTYKLNAELYANLVRSHMIRVKIAEETLKQQNA